VGGDQLLLLAQRIQEAERVRAEPHDRHDRQQHQRAAGARRDTRPLAPATRCQHHERQHQPRGGLHRDTDDQHSCSRLKLGDPGRSRGARSEREGACQHEQHERVVVSAAHRQLEQHRVQAHEHRRHLRRAAHPVRRDRRQGDRCEARGHGNGLQRPQATRQPERRQRIGAEREQGAVR